MKKASSFIRKQLPPLLLILAILFAAGTAYHFSTAFLDSDLSSELVLGELLAKQNKIVTTDYAYSSEIRFFNLNLIYMPLFKVFDNWHTVRYAAIVILQLLLLGSYYYLSRQMDMSKRAFALSAALMMLPVSLLYGRFLLYQNHYTPAAIYSFLIAGLYLSFIRHKGQKKIPQALRLFAMLLLAFASCLNGFRQLLSIMIPLFLTMLIVTVKNHRGAPGTLADVPKRYWAYTLLAAAVLAVGLAGLLFHTKVLSQRYSFRMMLMDSSGIALPSVDHMRDLLIGYLNLFGYQQGRTLFSMEGILALLGVFAAVVFLFDSLGKIVPNSRQERPAASWIGTLYPVAMLAMTLNFLLIPGNENYPQYYLTAFIWFFPYLGFLIDEGTFSFRSLTARGMLIWQACVCMALNGVFYNLYFLSPDDKQVQYDISIPYDTAPSLEGVSEFLIENEYEVGYASFWLANVMTEMTNGQIRMISIEYDYLHPGGIYYYDHLTYRQTREKEFVEGKSIFFLVANVELDLFNQSELVDYAIQVYADRNVRVFYFDFDTEVWDYMLQQAIDSNQTAVLEQLLEE